MSTTKVTPKMVQELRKRTGIGMSKCKQALDEAEGDMEKAIENLRKAGMASAVKKEARETNEGKIGFLETEEAIAFVEINAETDFVVQNERFQEFHRHICEEVLKTNPKNLEEFVKSSYSNNPEITIDEYRAQLVQALGENIQIRRLKVLKKEPSASYGLYSHMGGKIVTAAVLKGAGDQGTLAREIAMHIAAEAPEYLNEEEVPQEVIAKEREIAMEQVKNKPPQIVEKIVDGKIKAFFSQVCLIHQKYVKDPSITVQDFVKKASSDLEITQFLRWQIGQS